MDAGPRSKRRSPSTSARRPTPGRRATGGRGPTCSPRTPRTSSTTTDSSQGRQAIHAWISATMSEYPGSDMPEFPIEWYVIDEDRGWVVCQVWNRMRDPGDGTVHQEYNFTLLKYAGDGMWSYEEDVYNPMRFGAMVAGWEAARAAAGRLSPGRPDRTTRPTGAAALRFWRGATQTGEDRAPVVGGRPRGSGPRTVGPRDRRVGPFDGPGRRSQPSRRGAPVRPGPGAARPADPCGAGPAVRGLQDPAARAGDGVRAQLEESLTLLGCEYVRSLPDARRDRSGRARRPGRCGRGHPGRPGRGAVPVGGDHRPRAHGAGRPPRGPSALRPRHGDVPRQPAAVVGPRPTAGTPRRCSDHAARARRGRHGHQGGGRPAVGRPGAHLGHLVRALHGARRRGPWCRLRPLHPRRPCLLHARGHPGPPDGAGRRRRPTSR